MSEIMVMALITVASFWSITITVTVLAHYHHNNGNSGQNKVS